MPRKSTRAMQGSGTIRQREDGTWEARYAVGRDPGTGKQIRKSVYAKSQKEVRQKLAQAIAAIDKGIYQAPNKITVATWMMEWLTTFCANKVKPLTYQSYQGIIKNHIIPAFGAVELQAVKGTHIQRLYNSMTAAGLSGKTVKNTSAIMHKAFSVALKQGIIQVNPCDAAELPKTEHKEIHPLTDDEIPRFLAAIDESPMRNAFALCLFAGLREGECLGLSWKQVDFQKGRITVSQQLQKEKTKGAKYYIAPTTKSGKHYAIHTFYKRFKAIAAGIGRPDARPHDLRHTAATVAISSGADIKSVQDLLGHATASFTLNVYAHTSEKMMKDTAARMQSYYDGLAVKG